MTIRIGGTPVQVDQWLLAKVPWTWCSLASIQMFVQAQDEAARTQIQESLGRLVARKAVGIREKGVTMYKRLKEA